MTLSHYSFLWAMLAVVSGMVFFRQVAKLGQHNRATEQAGSALQFWITIILFGLVTIILIGLSFMFYAASRI
jgi:hypothetical protein